MADTQMYPSSQNCSVKTLVFDELNQLKKSKAYDKLVDNLKQLIHQQ
jgi:hypothetical protein